MARNSKTTNAQEDPDEGQDAEYVEEPEAAADQDDRDPNDYDGPEPLTAGDIAPDEADMLAQDTGGLTEPQDESQERRRRGSKRGRAQAEMEIPTGRPQDGSEIPPAIATAWDEALKRSEETGNTYVPVLAINVDMSVLPRETLDEDAVDRYADIIDKLPPIKVQRDTLTLIGGRHRLAGAGKAMRDVVRVEEVDAPDTDLFRLAVLDNVEHGVPLTTRERSAAARRLLEEHPEWGKVRIAEMVGMSRVTLWRWEHADDEAEESNGSGGGGGAPKDFLTGWEKMTARSATEEAMAVPADQAFARLTRVGAVRSWLDDYAGAIQARIGEGGENNTGETVTAAS